MLRRSIKHNKGVTAVEYGLIGALLSVVIIGSVALTGIRTKEVFCYIATHISEVVNVDNGGICSAGSGDSSARGNGSGGSNSDGDGSGSTPDNTDTSHITFDSNGIPEDIDGSLTEGGCCHSGDNDNYAYAFIVKTLTALNEIDPIYGTYGLYTSSGTSNPIHSLSDTINLLNDNLADETNGQDFTLYPSFGAFLSSNLLMEAQGVSGTVYKVGKDGTITAKDSGQVILTGDQYCNGLPCSSIYSTTK